jgi:hypothetical protein
VIVARKNDVGDVEVKTILKRLPVRLKDNEVMERGEQLARALNEMRAAEEEEKTRKAKAKMAIDALKEEADRLSGIVAFREEPRMVECEERLSLADGVSRIVRLDTGEHVETRSLSREELMDIRQGRLPNVIEFPRDIPDMG